MKVSNPVLRGVYPDPSVCYCPDNGMYYMVNSSFEYFPGVPISESKDLVNWKQIGHALTRPKQVELKKIVSSGGVYAPTIRYNKGRFYMVTTNDTYYKNFYVYTDDIYGEWSDPIFVDQGGIDPSLFFEGDKTYFMSNGSDPADGLGCIYQCEINVETGEKLTDSKPIWKGTGGRFLESPHLFKIGEWYYITAAEGGTEYGHMITCARGKSPYGPFDNCPSNPILTHRNFGGNQTLIQGLGHGDLVFTPEGESFIICLGFRQLGMWDLYHSLGREVFLVPVKWVDGWPVCADNGRLRAVMDMNIEGEQLLDGRYDVSFDKVAADSPRWVHLREYFADRYEFSDGSLTLTGTELTLDEADCVTFAGIRQSEFETDLRVTVESDCDEAGVTFYLCESHHYDVAIVNEEAGRFAQLKLHIGDAVQIVKKLPITEKLDIHIISTESRYEFFVIIDGEEIKLGQASMKYLSSEVAGGFTGTLMGLYAVDKAGKKAKFTGLDWKQCPRDLY